MTLAFLDFKILQRARAKLCCAALLSLLALPSHGAELRIALQDAETGQPLENAVVEVRLPVGLQAEYSAAAEFSVDQVEKEFVSTLTVITVGSRVNFPNSDDILHHVYSFSPAKVFELPLYGNGQNVNLSELFDQAGVVEIGCNIHDWMLGYIYVAQTRLAVKTDASGQAVISGVPAGDYTVSVWHPRAPVDSQELETTISFDDAQASNLRMALTLERDNRLRRAPNVSRTRYR
jgi:plastocyanin